jgi:uncharacterized protein with FMN-binding domain
VKRAVTATVTSLALATPAVNAAGALAATPKKKKVVTTTKTISGPQAEADRWGPLQVTLVVKKTTTTVGTKKTVTRKITNVKVPLYPDHTNRSVFINEQALPMLVQEVLSAQFNPNIDMISGATATSFAFENSLQSALLAAKKV